MTFEEIHNLVGTFGGTTHYDAETAMWTCQFGFSECLSQVSNEKYETAVLEAYRKWRGTYFVFGSNLRGYHGAGAALYAFHAYRAVTGVGIGFTGQAYAIPTKDENIQTLPLDVIQTHIEKFVSVSQSNPNNKFILSRVGCGLAGYTNEQIAPLFQGIGKNVIVAKKWEPWYPEHQTWIDK